MIWIVMLGFWHFKSSIYYGNFKIYSWNSFIAIISHVILFFWVIFTYYSFIFCSMAHDPTSCDMIMYSTLLCFHPSKTCGNITTNIYKSIIHAERCPHNVFSDFSYFFTNYYFHHHSKTYFALGNTCPCALFIFVIYCMCNLL